MDLRRLCMCSQMRKKVFTFNLYTTPSETGSSEPSRNEMMLCHALRLRLCANQLGGIHNLKCNTSVPSHSTYRICMHMQWVHPGTHKRAEKYQLASSGFLCEQACFFTGQWTRSLLFSLSHSQISRMSLVKPEASHTVCWDPNQATVLWGLGGQGHYCVVGNPRVCIMRHNYHNLASRRGFKVR